MSKVGKRKGSEARLASRRRFVRASLLALGGLWLDKGFAVEPSTTRPKIYRAAVIGRTGGGDYGHGYERIFSGLPNVTVEAVADSDPAGLKKAAESSGARRQYLDYREMLAKEKPDLVSIAPRHPDCHKEMALAVVDAGAHFFVEKPFTETLSEADEILSVAERKRIKIAVAHVRRYSAEFVQVKGLLQEGFTGTVREVRIQGKQDARAGGEDLMVLGTHDFDLMRFYFGDPLWCQASVTVEGRDLRRADIHRGREPMVVAGDTIHATFAFPNNLMVHWSSLKAGDHWNTNFSPREKWAFEILGTRRVLAHQSGFGFAYLESPFLAHRDEVALWKELPRPKDGGVPDHAKHPIRDLICAVETDTQPMCSGYDGRWAIEMVAAVYQSQKVKARVNFPLKDRSNPLSNWD